MAVRIAVLAGGVGAARFLAGLVRVVDPAEVAVVGNVGDDVEFYGLHICPDLDTVLYTLAGVVHPQQGWGRAGDTFRVQAELARFGLPVWFRLGDLDLAVHIFRTYRLRQGATLAEVTAEIARAFGVGVQLMPVSNDPVRTRVRTAEGWLDFQDYFVRLGTAPAVLEVCFDGAETARPAPGVLEAIADSEVVVLAPSNPIISLGPILAVAGVREALRSTRAVVAGISPIVGGRAIKGPADRMLQSLGLEPSAAGVARLFADFLDVWVIDRADGHLAAEIQGLGIRPVVTDTVMADPERAAGLARILLREVCRWPA
ncbi:MAG: 2-phospho-L-lactate transferase [Chloroflexota bacterium]